jgi:hypothetical protein
MPNYVSTHWGTYKVSQDRSNKNEKVPAKDSVEYWN